MLCVECEQLQKVLRSIVCIVYDKTLEYKRAKKKVLILAIATEVGKCESNTLCLSNFVPFSGFFLFCF